MTKRPRGRPRKQKECIPETTGYLLPRDFLALRDSPDVPDIRQRPPKTDAELLEEYFSLQEPMPSEYENWELQSFATDRVAFRARLAAIEQELGKELILEERIRRVEERLVSVEKKKRWQLPRPANGTALDILVMLLTAAGCVFLFLLTIGVIATFLIS